jgi:hypothetical protein
VRGGIFPAIRFRISGIPDGFPKERAMKRSLIAVPALLMVLAGCSGGDSDTPEPVPTLSSDLKKAADRWKDMTEDEQAAVCAAASGPLPGEGEIGGTSTFSPGTDPSIDYRAMLNAIEAAGYTQPEATAMLPYALNECR